MARGKIFVPARGQGRRPRAFLRGCVLQARALRFRIFKMGKYNQGMQMLARVLIASAPAMYIMMFFVLMGMILFGSLVFFFEEGVWRGRPPPTGRVGPARSRRSASRARVCWMRPRVLQPARTSRARFRASRHPGRVLVGARDRDDGRLRRLLPDVARRQADRLAVHGRGRARDGAAHLHRRRELQQGVHEHDGARAGARDGARARRQERAAFAAHR